jgi:cytochrome c peroxidase
VPEEPGVLTAVELVTAQTLGPLPAVPPDRTNKYADSDPAAVLGQMLFFDKSYSGALAVADSGQNGGLGAVGDKGKVSCHSCHDVAGLPLDDQRSKPGNVSLGTDFGTRNALGLTNSSFYVWTNWGGRFDSQWSLPLAVAENARIMKSTRLDVVHLLWNKYRTEYDAAFDTPLDAALDPQATDASRFPVSGKPKAAASDPDGAWEMMAAGDRAIANAIYVNYGKALQAYMRKLVSGNSPFDRWIAGDSTALSESGVRGLKLFMGKALCIKCHFGPTFADNDFHVLGVPQTGANVPATDLGRFQDVPALLASPFNSSGSYSDDRNTGRLQGLSQNASQRGQFRTKGLRNVFSSGPYMHAGQLSTLAEVVAFYNGGGGDVSQSGFVKDPLMKPLGLTDAEQSDLVEFLKGLSGEAIPAGLLSDTAK